VFYCKDAFEGLETVDRLQDNDTRASFTAKLMDDARSDKFLNTNVGKDTSSGIAGGQRSDVTADNPVPSAPFFGSRTLTDIPLDEVFSLLDLDELYRLQWGGRGSGPEYEATVKNEFEPTLARLKESAKRDGWLHPKAVYGYYPVQAAGNDLVIYDPEAYAADGTTREISRFHFPRQDGRERLCIADYFRSVGSTDVDVVAFQIVTVSDEATGAVQVQNAGEYTEAFYVHGSPWKPPKPSPNGCIASCDMTWAFQPARANATRGATAHVPTSRITLSSSRSCRPSASLAWS
jgi:5-methyltetrahydrofolate--homocysteine methyltransferase